MGVSKYSNAFKSQCIEKGVVSAVKEKKKELYYSSKNIVLDSENGVFKVIFGDNNEWSRYFYANVNDASFDCSTRLIESQYRKYTRAKDKISSIINKYEAPCFITFTFTDKVLKTTSALTRRRYVARFLKAHCIDYVANIDYSPKEQREHYHAIVGSRVDMSLWTYGFMFAEQIRIRYSTSQKLAKYINKLTSHAFKVDVTRLIYSRN